MEIPKDLPISESLKNSESFCCGKKLELKYDKRHNFVGWYWRCSKCDEGWADTELSEYNLKLNKITLNK